MLFPLYVSFFIFFKLELQQKAALHTDCALGVDYIRSQMDFLVCTFARDRGSSPMCFPLCVSLFLFVQNRIKQKAALQSVHLNAFAHVCFIFHFLSK